MKWRLAACRVQAQLNQREAAERLGVSETTLLHYEKGRRAVSMEKAQKMSEVYGIPLELMDFTKIGNRVVD